MQLKMPLSDNINILVVTNYYQSNTSDEEDNDGFVSSDEHEKEPHDVSRLGGGPLYSQFGEPVEVPRIFQFSTMSIWQVSATWIGDMGVMAHRDQDDEFNTTMEYKDKEDVINVINVIKRYSLNYSQEYEVHESNSYI